jgi:transmembrane sensor
MSAGKENIYAASTKAIKDQAADWLERSDRPTWSASDQAELTAWVSESPANQLAYWRVKGAWERAQRLRAVRPSENDRARLNASKSAWTMAARTAAVLIAIIVLGAGIALLRFDSHGQIFSTDMGGHKIVALADGSRVELNTATVLRVDIGADHRFVSIDKGEAYFDIAHDARHPFIVSADNRRITVLGTKFVVRKDTERLKVSLLEGRVWFDENDRSEQARSFLLTPGDEVVATAGSLSLQRKPLQQLQSQLGWRSGVLVFKYTALADAVAELNRYNRQKLVIADPAVARLTIVGTFPINNVGMFVRANRELFNLHVVKRGDETVISR